jgi:hypothetical protein
VPRPKAHLVRYHRLFAPNARDRAAIVARRKVASKVATGAESAPQSCTTPMSWMARLKRVFAIDLSKCRHCGGELQVIGAITDPGVIARILKHMGLDGRVQARAPPPVTS